MSEPTKPNKGKEYPKTRQASGELQRTSAAPPTRNETNRNHGHNPDAMEIRRPTRAPQRNLPESYLTLRNGYEQKKPEHFCSGFL